MGDIYYLVTLVVLSLPFLTSRARYKPLAYYAWCYICCWWI